MPNPKPLVTVIIPNFNRLSLLQACLRTLRAQTETRWRALVVDYGSVDGSAAYVRRLKGRIEGLSSLANVGFTGANLLALKQCRTPFVALVNNDVLLDPRWLAEALKAIRAHPESASIATRIVRVSDGLIDSAGNVMTRLGRGLKRGEGQVPEHWREPGPVFGAPAAAVLYRRSALEAVGSFDDRFFFNCEDLDLDLRLCLQGWQCWYQPSAVARHHVSASHFLLNGKALFYWSRNNEMLALKSLPLAVLLAYLPLKLFQESATLIRRILLGQSILPELLGKLAVLPLLGHIWEQRRRSGGKSNIPLGRLLSVLEPALHGPSLRRRVMRFQRDRESLFPPKGGA